MKIRFTKMQGLGNDFVVIDMITQRLHLTEQDYRLLGDRRFGIGCDQILLVEKPTIAGADFAYRILNQDGQEVEQCGNGARCFARFVYEQRLTDKTTLAVQTLKGLIYPTLQADGQVMVNMGMPQFQPADIPFLASNVALTYPLQIDKMIYQISAVAMGNPHAVLFVSSVADAPVATLGERIANHPLFPNRANAGFAEIISRNKIKLRVFERGVGETLACGTGACAAVVAGIQQQKLDQTVTVETRGGSLVITWQGVGHAVLMTGPAVTVFHGEIVWQNKE